MKYGPRAYTKKSRWQMPPGFLVPGLTKRINRRRTAIASIDIFTVADGNDILNSELHNFDCGILKLFHVSFVLSYIFIFLPVTGTENYLTIILY